MGSSTARARDRGARHYFSSLGSRNQCDAVLHFVRPGRSNPLEYTAEWEAATLRRPSPFAVMTNEHGSKWKSAAHSTRFPGGREARCKKEKLIAAPFTTLPRRKAGVSASGTNPVWSARRFAIA